MKKIFFIISACFCFLQSQGQAIHFQKGVGRVRFATSGSQLPFDPANLGADLLSWYDVTDNDAIVVDGGVCEQLTDKSPSARNITQAFAGTTFPLYSASGGAGNLPYITIDSAHTLFNSTGSYTGDGTIAFAVFRLKHTAPIQASGSYNRVVITYFQREYGMTLDSLAGGIAPYTSFGGSKSIPNYNNGASTDWQLISWEMSDTTITMFNKQAPVVTCQSDLTATGPSHINLGYFAFTAAYEFSELIICEASITDEQKNNVRTYLMNKYSIVPDNYMLTFGNSITAGNCGDFNNNWPKLTADSLGIDLSNQATGGTIVQPNNGSTGIASKNLIDVYQNGIGVQKPAWVTFMFGVNDVNQGGVNATWKTLYKNIIQDFIDDGYDPDSIIIIIPPSTTVRQATMATCNTYISEIASEMGLRLFDANAFFIANGGDSLFGDSLHPNAAGNLVFRNGLIAKINE